MRFSSFVFGAICVCFLAVLPPADAGTVLQYSSTPENYVSRIPGHTLTPGAKTQFQVGSYARGNAIYFQITAPGTPANGEVSTLLYQLQFSAPTGTVLGLGTYDYPGVYATATTPGFDFSGSQGISDPASGQFRITELTFDGSGSVFSFAADFSKLDRNNADVCYGSIQYNSGQPQPPAPPPAVTVTATTDLTVNGGAPGVFTIQRTGATTTALAVSYTLGGKAVNGTDYQRLGGVATIQAGKSAVHVKVRSLDTGTTGKVNVKIKCPTPADGSYSVAGSGQARINIYR